MLKTAQFLAVVLTALALVPGGAHLLALPNKIRLAAEPYFVTQGIYRGWALLGLVIIAALIANFFLAFLLYRREAPFGLALFAGLCIAVTLVVFFLWTYPANVATNNWTQVTQNWEALRIQWEYSHAVNAIITFIALCSVIYSVMTTRG